MGRGFALRACLAIRDANELSRQSSGERQGSASAATSATVGGGDTDPWLFFGHWGIIPCKATLDPSPIPFRRDAPGQGISTTGGLLTEPYSGARSTRRYRAGGRRTIDASHLAEGSESRALRSVSPHRLRRQRGGRAMVVAMGTASGLLAYASPDRCLARVSERHLRSGASLSPLS
jgi:hypothetical protein